MLIVQKFHSIHEIDPEFIPSLEILLQEEVPSFRSLIEKHDTAPASEVFTYFLFFGPTQNTPIGFAQLSLHALPGRQLVPWWRRIFFFWDKSYLHWKQLTWKVGDGNSGMYVVDPKYARTCKEKIQELIKEYEARQDIQSEEIYHLKGLQDYQSTLTSVPVTWTKDRFVLEPLVKAQKSYEEYLASLNPELRNHIKRSWKELHTSGKVELGDYPSAKETPKTIPVDEKMLALWDDLGAQILTFEKDLKILGCLLMLKGRNGNIYFEPIPFEPEGETLVSDELYTQYALLKFFEMPEARKCHLQKFGTKLVFDEKEDLRFFQEQNFQFKTVTQSFYSRLSQVTKPL